MSGAASRPPGGGSSTSSPGPSETESRPRSTCSGRCRSIRWPCGRAFIWGSCISKATARVKQSGCSTRSPPPPLAVTTRRRSAVPRPSPAGSSPSWRPSSSERRRGDRRRWLRIEEIVGDGGEPAVLGGVAAGVEAGRGLDDLAEVEVADVQLAEHADQQLQPLQQPWFEDPCPRRLDDRDRAVVRIEGGRETNLLDGRERRQRRERDAQVDL